MARKDNASTPQGAPETQYIATVKTALSGRDDGIVKKLPTEYAQRSVGEVLNYLTDEKQLQGDEVAAARSVRGEMTGNYTVLVNGVSVKPADSVKDLFEEKSHRGVAYNALDMEVASVQEGGLAGLLS